MRPVDRRNFLVITVDFVFFGAGMGFASQATVLPAFVATLTSSRILVGMVATLATGMWLLPQLFTANATAGSARRKRLMLIPVTVNRALFLCLGPLMLLLVPRSPAVAAAVFLALYGLFYLVDGMASVSWLDILGKILSPGLRARLISVGQALSSVAGIGAGVLVSVILASDRIPYPANYVLLISSAGVLLALSAASLFFLHEEPEHTDARPLPWLEFFRGLARILAGDRDFRRAVLVQVLFAFSGAATPFYVVHGLESLGFPAQSIGIFTSAQVTGGVLSALLMGYVGERRGTRAVMRLWGGVSIVTPLLALALSRLGQAVPAPALLYLYALVFVVVGAQGNSLMAGFLNYVLESAPPAQRAVYIGFANTASSISLAAPLLGGVLLAASGSWALLFAASAAGPLAGLVLSLKLSEPREGKAAG
jgi:MFS family permease